MTINQVDNVDKRKAEEPMVDQPEAKKSKVEVDLNAIRKQIEYYFSDDNLSVDAFFHGKIKASEEGWLDSDLILSCRKIKDLFTTPEHILEALKESALETKVGEDGVLVAVRRTQALPELKARERFEKKKTAPHAGGVVFKVSNVPADKKWGDVKDILKVQLPANSKVVFATSVNGEGAERSCLMLLSPFDKDIEFVKSVNLEFGAEESKVQCKVDILEGDDLKKAVTGFPRHVIKKRHDAARERARVNQKPIHLGEQKFANVNALRAKVKEILSARTNGQSLRPEAPDYQLVRAVLEFHPKAKEGKLDGMVGLKVDKHTTSDSRCFFVVKEDGSCDDISIMKCIQGIEANPPTGQKAEESKEEDKKVDVDAVAQV